MTEVTANDFDSYVRVQQSGVTNMFAVNTVCDLTGLSKEQVFEIMKNYSKYQEQFGEGQNVA